MKKAISLLLVLALLWNLCLMGYADSNEEFARLNDPELLQYLEDDIYAGLVDEFQSEDYIIEDVNTIYVSKEYLEELEYNSKTNIYFGYTADELNEQFQGTKYVFTLGQNGETEVQPVEDYVDVYKNVIKNVVIGSGVILVCVTVSVATGGAGLTTASMIFAASAKTGTTMALSSSVFSGVAAGVVKGIQTHNFDEAVQAAALSGSEGFKWGAISGALVGGVTKLSAIRRTASAVGEATEVIPGTVEIADDLPMYQQAELRALNETGGYSQLSYLNGELVDAATAGATRPDIVVDCIDHIEAIEVKCYNLESSSSLSTLYNELKREIAARVQNLPKGSTQKVILDITGRNFSKETIESVIGGIWTELSDIYPRIPIDIMDSFGVCASYI